MKPYINNWRWRVNAACEAESADGNPYILRRNWGNSRPVQLQITIKPPFGCDDWSTVDVQEISGPGSTALLSSPMPRIRPGIESPCTQGVQHAQCTNINPNAESGTYVFEVAVGTVSGETRRSELRLDLRP